MNEEPKTAAEASGTAPTIMVRAFENTKRVMALIRAKLGPGDEWESVCQDCEVGQRFLDVAETVISSRPDLELVWRKCPECRIREKLRGYGVPENLIGATLGNWTPSEQRDIQSLGRVAAFADRPKGFLILSSPEYGNGKSHLAVGILRSVYLTFRRNGVVVRFISQAQILESIRRRYDDPKAEDVKQTLAKVPFLVIDDVGVSGGGRDEGPALYDIISQRYDGLRPTVLTMNLSPEQFRDVIGARMASRLRQATNAWIDIHGPSFRAAKRNDYLDR
jgi:DNA replication protein DnaC